MEPIEVIVIGDVLYEFNLDGAMISCKSYAKEERLGKTIAEWSKRLDDVLKKEVEPINLF